MTKLSLSQIKASFELVSLINDEKANLDSFIFCSCQAASLVQECYEVLRLAATRGEKLSQNALWELIKEALDPDVESLLISKATTLASIPMAEWLAKIKSIEVEPNFEHCRSEG